MRSASIARSRRAKWTGEESLDEVVATGTIAHKNDSLGYAGMAKDAKASDEAPPRRGVEVRPARARLRAGEAPDAQWRQRQRRHEPPGAR